MTSLHTELAIIQARMDAEAFATVAKHPDLCDHCRDVIEDEMYASLRVAERLSGKSIVIDGYAVRTKREQG